MRSTDYLYADIHTTPIPHPDFKPTHLRKSRSVIPYLNGKKVELAVRGDAENGWVDVILDKETEVTERFYGIVQLMEATEGTSFNEEPEYLPDAVHHLIPQKV